MRKDDTPQPPGTEPPYATDEITIAGIGKAGVMLIVFFVMNLAIAAGAYYLFVVRETVPPAHAFESTPRRPDPNVPILQKEPVADIRKFRADEYDAERSYSHWKDGDGKPSLRIPLSRAMEIVKQSGLPKAVKPAPMPSPVDANNQSVVVPRARETTLPTESSSQQPAPTSAARP